MPSSAGGNETFQLAGTPPLFTLTALHFCSIGEPGQRYSMRPVASLGPRLHLPPSKAIMRITRTLQGAADTIELRR
jgi:hypothetical protein